MDDPKQRILAALPDEPRLVEARGLLRRNGTRALEVEGGGFVLAPVHGLAVAYGAPAAHALDDLVDAAEALGMDRFEMHAPEEIAAAWVDAGAATTIAVARILRWEESAARPKELVRHEVAALAPDDELADTLPIALRRELDGLERWPANAVALAGGAVASLAYSFVETEGHWDVSIDTLPDFRREGYATSAAAALIARQLARGLRPVWGANVENAASLALAARLGFVPCGSIAVVRVGP